MYPLALEAFERVKEITVTSSPAYIAKEYYIARAMVEIQPHPFLPQKIKLGGFSCGTDETITRDTARFELAERLLATYHFSDPLKRESSYPSYRATNHHFMAQESAENVLLGGTNGQGKDAVGLGFHLSKEKAIQHAIKESIERLLLARIWYLGLNLCLIEKGKFNEEFLFETYSIHQANIPFAMVLFYDTELNIFTLGASVSDNLQSAQLKALSEAIMLASDLKEHKSTAHFVNPQKKEKYASQRERKVNIKRISFIKEICTSIAHPNTAHFDLEDILTYLNIELDDFRYVLLHHNPYFCLARSYFMNTPSLEEYRKCSFGKEQYLLDPVC